MTIQAIIDQALYETHIKAAQINATQLLGWFNAIRRDLARTIISDVNENFFFEIWTRDLSAAREDGEYPLPVAANSIKGMAKLTGLSIKLADKPDEFIKAREADISAIQKDWDYYLVNQPKTEPIYFIADNSVFIAPKHEAADLITPTGNDQIKLYGIARVEDLIISDTNILIPDDYHPLIATGMQYHIYKSRGKINEAKAILSDYEMGKLAMVDKLTNRDLSSFSAGIPDDTALQY